MVRKHFPHLKIYARARNRFHYFRLRDLGVTHITRETFASSVDLGGAVLQELGLDATLAKRTTSTFAEYDNRLIETQYAVNRDEALLIQTAQAAGRELEELFEADTEIGQKTTQSADASLSASQPAIDLSKP
jgi:voltage-gated potassium channel Kch